MTKAEKNAIEDLRKSIKAAHKLGIRLAGTDGQLLYATREAMKKGKVAHDLAAARDNGTDGCYSIVAHSVAECQDGEDAGVLDSQCYEDSGGW
jgi:hypothetical protein